MNIYFELLDKLLSKDIIEIVKDDSLDFSNIETEDVQKWFCDRASNFMINHSQICELFSYHRSSISKYIKKYAVENWFHTPLFYAEEDGYTTHCTLRIDDKDTLSFGHGHHIDTRIAYLYKSSSYKLKVARHPYNYEQIVPKLSNCPIWYVFKKTNSLKKYNTCVKIIDIIEYANSVYKRLKSTDKFDYDQMTIDTYINALDNILKNKKLPVTISKMQSMSNKIVEMTITAFDGTHISGTSYDTFLKCTRMFENVEMKDFFFIKTVLELFPLEKKIKSINNEKV